jgi:hypothetical protein
MAKRGGAENAAHDRMGDLRAFRDQHFAFALRIGRRREAIQKNHEFPAMQIGRAV